MDKKGKVFNVNGAAGVTGIKWLILAPGLNWSDGWRKTEGIL